MFLRSRIRRFLRSFFGCQGICTRGHTSCAHSTPSPHPPFSGSPGYASYSKTKRPSDSTRFTVAGNTKHPHSSSPNRSLRALASGVASVALRSGRRSSLPGPRLEFTRSPTRYSSGPSMPMRTANPAMSCGNEIVFFLNFSSPVLCTLTIVNCMCSSATIMASVTVARAKSSPSSSCGNFQQGSM